MIIVSQDRKRIVENLNLGIREAGEYNKNYTIYNAETGENLGEYATEKRAKEVLALIYKTYADQMLIKHTRGDIQTALIQGDPNKYFDVFEMPEN